MIDRPREGASILSGPYQGQGPSGTFASPRPSLRTDSADDIQGNILCAQLGGFHFTPQYGSHGHATIDEPTAIIENSYVRQSIEPEPYLLRSRVAAPGVHNTAYITPHPFVDSCLNTARTLGPSPRTRGRGSLCLILTSALGYLLVERAWPSQTGNSGEVTISASRLLPQHYHLWPWT